MDLIYKPRDILGDVIDRLSPYYDRPEAKAISGRLLEEVLNIRTADVVVNDDILLNGKKQDELNNVLDRLAKGEPFQYILGHTWFRGRKFEVNPNVMIPRQETEEFVELVVQENKQSGLNILDIGTGSGCIAISLSCELDNAEVHACDISKEALITAKANSDNLNGKLELHLVDILQDFPPNEELDIIVSNPPYVREMEQKDMDANVLEFEPQLALFVSDSDPLLFYRTISDWAKTKLKKEGIIYFEINEAFGDEIEQLLHDQGFEEVRIVKDLNGKDRIAVGVR